MGVGEGGGEGWEGVYNGGGKKWGFRGPKWGQKAKMGLK